MKFKLLFITVFLFSILPSKSQTVFSDAFLYPSSLLVVDDYLYVGTFATHLIGRIEINDPNNTEVVSDFSPAGGPGVWKMAYNPIENDIYAYDNYYFRVDLDQNLPIEEEVMYSGAGCYNGMAQKDGILYLACGNKINTFDATLPNATHELFVQLGPDDETFNPVFNGDELYFAVKNNNDSNLYKLNINAPSETLELVSTLVEGAVIVQSSLVADNYLYLGTEGTAHRVLKLDLSNSNLPIEAETLIDDFVGGPIGLARSGNRIFISDGITQQIWEYTDLTLSTTKIPLVPFSLHPNPASDTLFLSNLKTGNPFTIYSINGKALVQGFYSEEGIDLATLQPGMYFLQVTVDGFHQTAKFIKH